MLAAGLPDERTARTWIAPDWGALTLRAAAVTFNDQLHIWCGDLLCEVRYAGSPAHTTNDAIVWLPEHSILFAGDLLFNGGTPFILGGSLAGAIDAVAALANLEPQTIVPGHGPVCGPEVIRHVLGYLRFVDDLARTGLAAGLSPLEAAMDTDLGGYSDLLDDERIVANLHRAYADLTNAPLDRAAALSDMVTYNGGRLRCDA